MISTVLAFGWFTCSIAWAAGVSGLKDATNGATLVKELDYCKDGASKAYENCTVQEGATYGALNVSIVSTCNSINYLMCMLCQLVIITF